MDDLAGRFAALLREASSKIERDMLRDYLAVESASAPQRDLLADLMAKKRAIEALPPMLLAVKCHPASEHLLRREVAPSERDHYGLFSGPEVFWDVRVPWGKFVPAYDRATVNAWKLESWRKYLIRKLEDRILVLTEAGHA